MLIESIALEGIGPFRERLALGPLRPGLNILAQPNEWGKSTVVQALGRALFDRYSSGAEEIRQLRPTGSSLSPRIELIFATAEGRHRLVKRFLDHRSSELFRWSGEGWDRTDESDRADQRIRELLGAPSLDGRVAKPETWGFLRYLWARQDDPCCWPQWDGEIGTTARRRLAAVEIDPIARALTVPLQARADALFTVRGKVRAGCPLAMAEAGQQRIEASLETIRTARGALEQLQEEYLRLSREVPVLDRARLELRAEAVRLQCAAVEAQQQTDALHALEIDRQRADTALQQVAGDAKQMEAAGESLRLSEIERATLDREATALGERLPILEHALARTQADVRENAAIRADLERRLQAVRERIKHAAASAEHQRIRAAFSQAELAAEEVTRLETHVARLPAISTVQLEQWREWSALIREDTVRLESLGLTIELRPDADGTIQVDQDGAAGAIELRASEVQTVHAAEALRLDLPGWGTLQITSGAEEAINLRAASEGRSDRLESALHATGVASLAEAEVAFDQLREMKAQLTAARRVLAARLGEWKTLSELRAAVEKAEANAGETELASPILLEAEEQELSSLLHGARASETTAVSEVDAARISLDSARRAREELHMALAGLAAREKGLQEQQALLAGRYSGAVAEAVCLAQAELVRTEARLAEARRLLPVEAKQLPDRSQRAGRAATEAEAAWQQAADELRNVTVRLEERGSEGLYTRESELEEMLPEITAEAARLRREGLAARLAAELIVRRERSAVRTVLRPLEDRLTDVFTGLTGVNSRRVWFDETLQIRGVGLREEELVGFDQLSRGAREQLLLALRAAIALELAADGPQCVVLDDVLVHTDAVRHQNVLDYLEHLATRVQVLLLTCHAERYRGLGHILVPMTVPPKT